MSFNFPTGAKELHKYIANKISHIYDEKEAFSVSKVLLMDLLNLSGSDLLMDKEISLNNQKKDLLKNAIDRLQKNEPVQHITGRAHFFDLEFKVNRNVLIPRPETEELVQAILDMNLEAPQILDIGTGTGCIAISLARNIHNSKVEAIDVDSKVLEIARENARRHQVKIDFHLKDILSARRCQKTYDIVVSNPPYIPNSDKKKMHRNVLDFEPEIALFVPDEKPLLFYKKIAEFSVNCLAENGHLVFEIHENIGDRLKKLLTAIGFNNVDLKKDLQGKERMIIACF